MSVNECTIPHTATVYKLSLSLFFILLHVPCLACLPEPEYCVFDLHGFWICFMNLDVVLWKENPLCGMYHREMKEVGDMETDQWLKEAGLKDSTQGLGGGSKWKTPPDVVEN